MELIDRYLGAVRWNLPRDKADDILAELADVIATRIEEREDALDRALNRAEISEVLREFGHPIAVAARYRPQQVLIGPELFPFYWFILRLMLFIVVLVQAIDVATSLVSTSEPLIRAAIQAGSDLFQAALYNAAIVTLLFALIEHTGLLGKYLARWQPDKLPKIAIKPPRKRQLNPFFAIAFSIGFLLWWSGLIDIDPLRTAGSDYAMHGTAVWQRLHMPIFALVSAGLILHLVTLLRPQARLVRAALLIAIAAGTILIAATLHQAGSLIALTPLTANGAAHLAEAQSGINEGLNAATLGIGILAAFRCVIELWLMQRKQG
ncbi:hypothetical protein [Sphingosinithalassobacter portus]|uniref:hypothetical protein n=1 Tax=Stakelama portus TaxID=2676234 RepID=UPI000D6E9085|nr:hypothetical protein [Sphingosinithalassobacter portus]